MKVLIATMTFSLFSLCSYAQKNTSNINNNKTLKNMMIAENKKITEITCKLTTPELRKRKETVIASLKQKINKRKELKNGYAFNFSGTNEIINDLIPFIKTERDCCDFFIFTLSISGDKNEIWLNITGPKGTKEFIKNEIGFLN